MGPQSRFLFPPESLPPGFRYPDSYLKVVNSPELPDLDPCWLLAENEQLALFWQRTLRQQFPRRLLVPFAKWDTSDDLACFDGANTSGNPDVLLIHAYCTPGWEHRGTLPDFEAWLAQTAAAIHRFAAGEP